MRISVFGLGYVGVVTAACLANEGHHVVGVDVNPTKVDLVNKGESPIVEDQIGELIAGGVSSGRLMATVDAALAISKTDLAIVCVGTPSRKDGSLDNQYIRQVIEGIGRELRNREKPFHVVVRSTMVPGTLRGLVIPVLEKSSGKALGNGYDVVFHPEFLREGSSVYDFYNPPKIVVGEAREGSAQAVLDLYDEKIVAPRIVCEIEVAEMVKYCDNLYHAVKVTFANEVGQFCRTHGINSQRVMEIFCQDTKLNISHRYLKPGFAFGGSCLPKDLRAFLSVAHNNHLELPMLQNVLPSNVRQIERTLELILSMGVQRIGFYGIAFKQGTDDLRESPLIELAERLLGKGKQLVILDEKVRFARLLGGNRSYVVEKFPHLVDFLTDKPEDIEGCELILVGHSTDDSQVQRWIDKGSKVLDLTGRYSQSSIENLSCIV